MPNTLVLGEHIIDYTFRENGAIFIPKAYRKRAVIMQVDIKVVSVARELYLNYESSPAEGYYGYATLVMRDFCLPPIQISQPRQTLYYARLENAIVNWAAYIAQIRAQENFKGIESLICTVIGQLGGACVDNPCVPLAIPVWEEIPLREVYVNCHYGTQFEIELSYIDMNDVIDNCGNYVRAESGWSDGDKDNGLPPDGVAPSKAADPNNPYIGLPPVSTTDELGVLPPSKQNNLDDTNPGNLPSEEREYRINYVGRALSPLGVEGDVSGTFTVFLLPTDTVTLYLGEFLLNFGGIDYYAAYAKKNEELITQLISSTPYAASGWNGAPAVSETIPL